MNVVVTAQAQCSEGTEGTEEGVNILEEEVMPRLENWNEPEAKCSRSMG